jgi:uncharacterized protein YdiU (UPF0061 family)
MRVGFVHGVMNTDNMSVLGLTIDYGPYGWLEDFDPDWTPNTTDRAGRRYRYSHQPAVALWNLVRFAEAIAPLVGSTEPLEAGISVYQDTLERTLRGMLLQKLGLAGSTSSQGRSRGEPASSFSGSDASAWGIELGDDLMDDLARVLQLAETDMTIFFRKLADVAASPEVLERASDAELLAPLAEAYYQPEQLTAEVSQEIANWLRRYVRRVLDEGTPNETRQRRMNAVNPKFVLRNYLAQTAIDPVEQAGDAGRVRELLDVLRHPYDEQPGKEEFALKRPEWARHRPGCSMLSCSS